MGPPWHDILMITYNRPEFTRLALQQLLNTCDEHMRVWLWHNGTDPQTLAVVHELKGHPSVHSFRVSEENKKLREPTNWFWANADGAYLSKVDDDCLVPDGWARTLRSLHDAAPSLGVAGCWRFYTEDVLLEKVRKKLLNIAGSHHLMVNDHVQGSGYVMKRAVYQQLGPLRAHESFTGYCRRCALRGWWVGWVFPFVHEEHMDDPRSPWFPFKDDSEFYLNRSLTATSDNVSSIQELTCRSRARARMLQTGSANPRRYVGCRRHLSSLIDRVRFRLYCCFYGLVYRRTSARSKCQSKNE